MTVVELRQYTLKPQQRDVLIALFEREFVESQEELDMKLFGTFRDADDPDRFVWLRGFTDMESRARSLAAFYGGPVWKAHRDAANATMIDSGNVLLLRPAWSGSGFTEGGTRGPIGSTALPGGLVVAAVCQIDSTATDAFVSAFRRTARSTCAAAGGRFLSAFVSEHGPNTFPALPVREVENVFVWFTLFADVETGRGGMKADMLEPELHTELPKPIETLRLLPTPRSLVHA
ncbi:MAG TPA: NIPSNAP family protein [Rhizomicrobium sp.]|jgi:quinol monooxygenase YgiN